MPPDSFDYPLGIRPWRNDRKDRARRQTEGYLFSLLENSADAYRFSAIAGATKIPAIFRSFARLLPEEAFLILEYYQEEAETDPPSEGEDRPEPTVFYSPYLPTEELLDLLEPYLDRLVHDGFVGFGLANNRAGFELFCSEEKVLTCFTGNHLRMMDLFARHDIPFDPRVKFPSDFGHDHLSLLCHPRTALPAPLCDMPDEQLDYLHFCAELTEELEMYPVEETLSFFFSQKEQDLIEERLFSDEAYADFADDDFGGLLLDWDDFVCECQASFEGDLWEYRQGLRIRDAIQFVIDGMPKLLREKILDIVREGDETFQKNLIDRRKRLDPPGEPRTSAERFWYHGMVRNQGAPLRRDLIRQGWYKP